MLSFLFGKKKKKHSSKGRKPPSALLRMCKKYSIKVTRKVGKKRIYKKVSVLKRQLKQKMKKNKRRSSFGKKKLETKPKDIDDCKSKKQIAMFSDRQLQRYIRYWLAYKKIQYVAEDFPTKEKLVNEVWKLLKIQYQ